MDAAAPAAPLAAPADMDHGRTGSPEAGLLDLVLTSLDNDKAEDVVSIPLAGKSDLADHLVIASGRSTRQVAAISEKLVERLKAEAGVYARVEGLEAADWVLIDCGDAIVHVFRPEVREYYQLEKMWLTASAQHDLANARG